MIHVVQAFNRHSYLPTLFSSFLTWRPDNNARLLPKGGASPSELPGRKGRQPAALPAGCAHWLLDISTLPRSLRASVLCRHFVCIWLRCNFSGRLNNIKQGVAFLCFHCFTSYRPTLLSWVTSHCCLKIWITWSRYWIHMLWNVLL